ncbi:outer membrane beta-barrel protein [Litoribacter populi]|uniref:outer membrane beta-barrel protein n=1 Tax=Litoribacter populi TaxID=2598460 RepID=UPI00117EE56F|nr:outer membrane beta-barrel protein [Litoribacter populi]
MKKVSLILLTALFLQLSYTLQAQDKNEVLVEENESKVAMFKGNLKFQTRTYEDQSQNRNRTNVDFSYEHSSEAIYRDGKNLIPRSYFTIDLGKGIWQGEQAAPDVRVWGSWMVGLNMVRQMKVSNQFYVKGIAGVHFHNFKFADDNIQAVKGNEAIEFNERAGGVKSKVAASYLTLALIPKISTGHNGFRIGAGPYAGYRLGGRGKFVYQDNGRNKDFDRSDMFLENLRYGMRGELGISWLDFFFNYDLNHVFQSNRGPEVNAMSFGIIL